MKRRTADLRILIFATVFAVAVLALAVRLGASVQLVTAVLAGTAAVVAATVPKQRR